MNANPLYGAGQRSSVTAGKKAQAQLAKRDPDKVWLVPAFITLELELCVDMALVAYLKSHPEAVCPRDLRKLEMRLSTRGQKAFVIRGTSRSLSDCDEVVYEQRKLWRVSSKSSLEFRPERYGAKRKTMTNRFDFSAPADYSKTFALPLYLFENDFTPKVYVNEENIQELEKIGEGSFFSLDSQAEAIESLEQSCREGKLVKLS